jgi:hypothetical protein
MAVDCANLSKNALRIYKKLKRFFPPGPFGRVRWLKEGTVEDNGELDLRKSEDRNRLIERTILTLGSFVENAASVYTTKNRTLDGFEIDHFGPMIKNKVELLIILRELDFQIETGDFLD